MDVERQSPLKIGWEAVKVNVVPMVVLWVTATFLVIAYYTIPAVTTALEPMLRWQKESGYMAAALNRAVFYGLLPGAFQILLRTIRPKRPFVTISAQSLWCAAFGVLTDALYRTMSALFGDGTDIVTLVVKTLINQFVWTAFVGAPANATFYFWVARDFSIFRTCVEWPHDFVHGVVLPNLLSNWCVWIPVNMAVFSLPLPLQVQVSGMVGSFWTLMCIQIGAHSR